MLIGNIGNGKINNSREHNGRFDNRPSGQVRTSSGQVSQEPGLWALQPGNAETGGTN